MNEAMKGQSQLLAYIFSKMIQTELERNPVLGSDTTEF